MTITLNHDAFEGDDYEPKAYNVVDGHHVVYGRDGNTDELSRDTIATLLRVGIIVLFDVLHHDAGMTYLYRSVAS